MTIFKKIIDYINNHFWADSSWFTLTIFFFLFGTGAIWLGKNFIQLELVPMTEIEVVANKIELVSNKTGSGRADSNTLRIYINDESSPSYFAPCGGNVSSSFCDYRKTTVLHNAKMKFMIQLLKNKYEQNKRYDGHILSLIDSNGNALIKYDVNSAKSTRDWAVKKYFFDLCSAAGFLVAFLILLVRIVHKFKKD